jgi:uncharacterized repeat protein (TIGR01451 family)
MFEQLRQLLRENRQLWTVIIAAILALVLVVWGVWGGFQVEFSRFFAGQEPLPPSTGACGPAVSEGGSFNWNLTTSKPWGGCADGTAATYWTKVSVGTCHPDGLHLVWRAEHRNKQSCNVALAGAGIAEGQGITTAVTNFSNMDLPDGQAGTARMTYNPSTFNCGSVRLWGAFWADGPESREKNAGYTGYYKVINYGVDCEAGPGPAPVPSPTATPDYPPPQCSPANQTAAVGQPVLLQATSGNGESYTWDFSGGGVLEEGGNRDIVLSWSVPGQKAVRVTSAGKTSQACIVFVSEPTPTPSAVPGNGAATVTKSVRNTTTGGADSSAATVMVGQTLAFTVRIVNTGTVPITGLTVRDELPLGMSYISGSTRVEDQAVPLNTITTSGLVLGTLNAGDPVTVQWSAVADQSGLLQPGSRTATATVTFDDGGLQTAGVTVTTIVAVVGIATPTPTATIGPTGTPTGTGTGAGIEAGVISTGPSDSVLAALAVAALAALLYAAHTRSPSYRRHELRHIGEKRDPLDFKH